MKQLNIKLTLNKILKIINKHGQDWGEKCSYYSHEETQCEVFARRVNAQIIGPFFAQFKLLAFSYAKNSDLKDNKYSIYQHFATLIGFTWSYGCGQVYLKWFDVEGGSMQVTELTESDLRRLCIFDATKDSKIISGTLKLKAELADKADEAYWSDGLKEHVIHYTYIREEGNTGKSYSQVMKAYEKLTKEEKEDLFRKYRLEKRIPDADSGYKCLLAMLGNN